MIRLFVPDPLAAAARIEPAGDQARYLTAVMRLGVGDELLLFNGRDGEWRARLAEVSKRGCAVEALRREREQATGPDLDLVVALGEARPAGDHRGEGRELAPGAYG
jgi:16S rRNA (uracil1498-N3)-methyltransferase